jgi:magnesium transporter
MLNIYSAGPTCLKKENAESGLTDSPVWIDMVHPTAEEEAAVQNALKVELPTREEMQEIEISSRLYRENGALYMTATLLSNTDTETPEAKPATFVLSGNRLLTIRYTEPRPFRAFASRVQRVGGGLARGDHVLAGLLDAIVDRTADILERIAADIDTISRDIFEYESKDPTKNRNFQDILHRIGRKGELNSKARESLVSIGRLLVFLNQSLDVQKCGLDTKSLIDTLIHDVHALTDHATFLSNNINFLLDATLGMINTEQNAIIKIFSVASVALMPPTLIASIYGMNFKIIPELHWSFGYPLALLLMVISALLPWWYFRRRGWL